MKLVEKDGAVLLGVHAKPRARKSKLVGERGEGIDVALAAPPVDGAANDELVRFIASLLGVAKRDVELVRGQSSREKLLSISGLRASEIEARLRAELDP